MVFGNSNSALLLLDYFENQVVKYPWNEGLIARHDISQIFYNNDFSNNIDVQNAGTFCGTDQMVLSVRVTSNILMMIRKLDEMNQMKAKRKKEIKHLKSSIPALATVTKAKNMGFD